MNRETVQLLRECADKYETAEFLDADPSQFMHRVDGAANQEATAFVASCLSFGARSQFLPKVQWLIDCAGGDMDRWIRTGAFERDVPLDATRCFYRFFTFATMNAFFREYRRLMSEHGTLGGFVRKECGGDAAKAVAAIRGRFGGCSECPVVPKDAHSACKRVCMFLRWMVRSGSPVDLGLWADFIDRRTLVMPLDTHVLSQACRIGLLKSRNATMSTAIKLTETLKEVFPDDPLRGDFALFGYGVNIGDRR